jgi:hypothetical protein
MGGAGNDTLSDGAGLEHPRRRQRRRLLTALSMAGDYTQFGGDGKGSLRASARRTGSAAWLATTVSMGARATTARWRRR